MPINLIKNSSSDFADYVGIVLEILDDLTVEKYDQSHTVVKTDGGRNNATKMVGR